MRAEDSINAALALSISTLNTLYELRVVTLDQAKQTVAHALMAVAPAERDAAREVLRRSIPTFVE